MVNLRINLEYNDKKVELQIGKATFLEELYSECRVEADRFSLTLHPKQNVVVKKLTITYLIEDSIKSVYCNGFQSWTETKDFLPNDKIQDIRGFAKPFMGKMGDTNYIDYPEQEGYLHSWSWITLRKSDDSCHFFGSLAEYTGFTSFMFSNREGYLTIEKDCGDFNLEHSWHAFDLVVLKNTEYDSVWKKYTALHTDPAPKPAPPIAGWTSWYQYYTNIDEAIIDKNISSCEKILKKAPETKNFIFQIDDGWQQSVGDWLVPNKKFSGGLARFTKKVKQSGMTPGLWLAPFLVEKKSAVFQKYPHWILKDDKGKPIKIGYNPLWSGWFYALDFYQKEVQDYLGVVLDTVLNKWGFDLVKLDFLYAVCVKARPNKTRGQIMQDAMNFLRERCGNKLILGCGVPLTSAIGNTDYCRIGADVHLKWEHSVLKWLHLRERVSTRLSVENTISRYPLNQNLLGNDPDVFILRDRGQKLSLTEREILFYINTLLGSVFFTSDCFDEYTPEQQSRYLVALEIRQNAQILDVKLKPNHFFEIWFKYQNKTYTIKGETITPSYSFSMTTH